MTKHQVAQSVVPSYRDVLLALLGMSPAVLTETIWALVHEEPPVVPHDIVVLTTVAGRRRLRETLFASGEWDVFLKTLKNEGVDTRGGLRFGDAGDHVRLFPSADGSSDLDDIVTAEDSHAAADFMMRVLRQFTEDPETRVIASIAGGRKTMGALLTSCITILGRSQDRLCHVLVNPPYDSPALKPSFLFPKKGVSHRLPHARKTYRSPAARIELTEIPFVSMRGLYERVYKQVPPGFLRLVRSIQRGAPLPANYPNVKLDLARGSFEIGGKKINLSAAEFALTVAVCRLAKKGAVVRRWEDLEPGITELRAIRPTPAGAAWLHDFCERGFDVKEDARKLASSIRRKLKRALHDPDLVAVLMPSPKAGAQPYPANRIRIMGLRDVS